MRDYLLDLYNDLNDKVGDLVDRVTGNKSGSSNSSSNGSSGNTQPPQNPIDPNKLHHIFDDVKHKLDPFLGLNNGDQEAAYRAIVQAGQKYVDATGLNCTFHDVYIEVNGLTIGIEGTVIDGVVKISSAWIQ